MTGLHAAAHFDLPPKRLLESLIDLKVMDINTKCSDGQTALHWAIRYGRLDLLRLLIDKEANPNMRDKAGDAALHMALGLTGGDVPLHKAIMRSADDDDGVAEAFNHSICDGCLIFEDGTNIRYQDSQRQRLDDTSQHCFMFRLLSLKVVQCLVGKSVNVKLANNDRWILVRSAADDGRRAAKERQRRPEQGMQPGKTGVGMRGDNEGVQGKGESNEKAGTERRV